jgi:hypothetical protein
MVGELESSPAFRCQPVCTVLSRERTLRYDMEVLQLLQEFIVEAKGHGVNRC